MAVVNTCAFLQSAVRESREAIAPASPSSSTSGRLRALIVTGCLAQRAGESLLVDFPEVDAVLGTGQWKDVVPAARHVLDANRRAPRAHRVPGRRARRALAARALDAAPPRVSQDLRGLRSPLHLLHHPAAARGPAEPPIDDLVAEARAPRGARRARAEPDRAGHDRLRHRSPRHARRSPTCSRRSTEVEGIHWIRVQYTYPRLWSDRLIWVWANARRVVPYVDMPLQHIAPTCSARWRAG